MFTNLVSLLFFLLCCLVPPLFLDSEDDREESILKKIYWFLRRGKLSFIIFFEKRTKGETTLLYEVSTKSSNARLYWRFSTRTALLGDKFENEHLSVLLRHKSSLLAFLVGRNTLLLGSLHKFRHQLWLLTFLSSRSASAVASCCLLADKGGLPLFAAGFGVTGGASGLTGVSAVDAGSSASTGGRDEKGSVFSMCTRDVVGLNI
jgi:hypothetical protein